jgi:hypothetical protein
VRVGPRKGHGAIRGLCQGRYGYVYLSVSLLGSLDAKCVVGITQLFEALILAIIAKKDIIEQENELKRHDSVILASTLTPTWAAQADEEEAREKEAARSHAARSCCQV